MRTKEEIERQVESLEAELKTVPRNDRPPIEAQIAVLRGTQTPDDYYVDETAEEYEFGDNEAFNAAQEAADWLAGKTDRDLVEYAA